MFQLANYHVDCIETVNNVLLDKAIDTMGRATHATELVLQRPGFFWPSYHLVHNSNSHVAD